MPDNIQHVLLSPNTWVDLYAETGIAVGVVINVENVGNADVNLTVLATQPAKDHDAFNVLKRPPSVNMQNSEGDLGAWAYCPNTTGKLAISSPVKNGFIPTTDVRLQDGFGNPIGSLSGAINVHNADVHNVPVNDFVHRHTDETTLTVATNIGDTQITIADATGFVVGAYVHLGPATTPIEPIHPRITVVAGTIITLDRPLDFTHAIGDLAIVSIVNLVTDSVLATLENPIVYRYLPHAGEVEHITRLLLEIIHTAAGADDRFGSIPALVNGVVLRATVNGQTGTFTNWKDNGDIKLDMFDVNYSDKVGGGNFGTNGRGSFSRIDTVIRLDPAQNDFIEVLIQDDLEALVDFRIKMQGHDEGR